MKRISFILVLGATLVLSLWISQQPVSAESSNRVLLILRESIGSVDKQTMTTDEAVMMKRWR